MDDSMQPEDGASGPAGRTEPGEGDARARIATLALAALSALFFAGALAYAVGGGLLSVGDRGQGEQRTLPPEWANMIPLQPVGPELVDADPGAGGSNGFGANRRRRGGPRGFFAAGAGAPPFRPVAARRPALRPPLGVRRIRPRGGLFRPISAVSAPRLDRVGVRLPRLPDLGGGGTLPDVDPIPGPVLPPIDPGPGGGPVPPIDVEIPPIVVDIPPIVVNIPPINVNIPGDPLSGGAGTPPLLPLTQASAARPSDLSLMALAGTTDGDSAEGSERSRSHNGDAERRERPPAPASEAAGSPTGTVDSPSVRGADRRNRRDERDRGKAETAADRTARGNGSLESAHCQAASEPKLPPASSERTCDDETDGEPTEGEARKATKRSADPGGRAARGAGTEPEDA